MNDQTDAGHDGQSEAIDAPPPPLYPVEQEAVVAFSGDAGEEHDALDRGGRAGLEEGSREETVDVKELEAELARECPETIEQRFARLLPSRWMLHYCLALRTLGVARLAAARAKVNSSIVDKWRKVLPVFERCVQEAMRDATDAVEASLRVSATVGDVVPVYQGGICVGFKRVKDVRAAEIILKAERPEKYREQKGDTQQTAVVLASPEDVRRILATVVLPALSPKQQPAIDVQADVERAG